jgi:16S rRNA (cytosine967-C5)-methyltransferase
MPTPARRLAFQVLADLDRGGPTLGDRLAAADVSALDPRERGFLHELVLGTLRRRGEVDHALAALLDRPLAQVQAPVVTALRLGAYQILRLRVPARAAVSESVELARAAAPRAAGFVNAVLRGLARDGPAPAPDPAASPLAWMTSAGSLPRWLAERWLARLGTEAALARTRALLEPPPTVFRPNPRRPEAMEEVRAAGLEAHALPVPGAWLASDSLPAALLERGAAYVQDQGSQMVGRLAGARGRILDACAAPGGKATLMADDEAATRTVVAAEASLDRARRLATLVARWGSPNVHVAAADALRPPFREPFDVVLLDAPCSGLGTIGRNPDIRWRARAADLQRQSARQRALLAALAPLVAPGGRLVYSTCSSEPEENETVVAAFLERNRRFTPEPLPKWARPFAAGPFAATTPERDRGDAFFAAVLRAV